LSTRSSGNLPQSKGSIVPTSPAAPFFFLLFLSLSAAADGHIHELLVVVAAPPPSPHPPPLLLLTAAMLQIGETPELRNLLVKYENCLHCDEVMMVEPEEEEEAS
jgi:hypothetical protein